MILKTPNEMAYDAARRFRSIRKSKGISIKALSESSGVPYSTIRRFEKTGEAGFLTVVKLASSINEDGQIEALFDHYVPRSIEEVIRGNSR